MKRFPDRAAFVQRAGTLTYGAALSQLAGLQSALAARGVGRGTTVAVLSPNRAEGFLTDLAVWCLGGRHTALHGMGSLEDHVMACADAEARFLVVDSSHAGRAADISTQLNDEITILSLGPSAVGEDLLAAAGATGAGRPRCVPCAPDEVAWLAYTGGTTGTPKAAALTHRNLMHNIFCAGIAFQVPAAPVYLATAPITHAAMLPLLSTLARSGTMVLEPGFDPQRFLELIGSHRVNYTYLVPTMIYSVLDQADPESADLSSLESLRYGASPVSPSRLVEAIQRMGQVFVQGYQCTESTGIGTSLWREEHDPVHYPDLLSSCGHAVPGVEVELLDDDGHPVGEGATGELCLRGPSIMSRYWKQPDLTRAALRGGWLHTGDIATRDDRGYYYIVDRLKDVVITGGFNVYPREIEDVLLANESVARVAVIGVPDPRWGEAVKAFVVARPGKTIDCQLLTGLVRERKGRHAAPKSIEVVASLPLTPVGKIDKKALRLSHGAGLAHGTTNSIDRRGGHDRRA
jgi:fatty-acyl-CoA synthase